MSVPFLKHLFERKAATQREKTILSAGLLHKRWQQTAETQRQPAMSALGVAGTQARGSSLADLPGILAWSWGRGTARTRTDGPTTDGSINKQWLICPCHAGSQTWELL